MLFKGLEGTGNIKDPEFPVVASFYATGVQYMEGQEEKTSKAMPFISVGTTAYMVNTEMEESHTHIGWLLNEVSWYGDPLCNKVRDMNYQLLREVDQNRGIFQ